MTKNIDSRKLEIFKQIISLDSEDSLELIENYLKQVKQEEELKEIFKPIRDNISVEELKAEQNYTGFNREKFDQLVKELDIQESLEELLSMID